MGIPTRIATLALIALGSLALMAGAAAAADGDGSDAQARYDGADGGWANTTAGVAGRPFVKRLVVDGTVVIDNAAGVASPTIQAGQSLTATVQGYNICRTGQQPAQGQCYADPNRIAISLERYLGAGQGWTTDLAGSSTPQVTEASTIDVTIGFRPAFSTIGWSWLNGTPSYWRASVVAGAGGEIRTTFKATPIPSVDGQDPTAQRCTTIPVSECDVTRATAEVLRTEWVVSTDDTLGATFAGTLFASNKAIIGSLEASPVAPGQTPTLTYGAAAPHELADGQLRVGTFHALVPESLLGAFGTSMAAFDPSIMSVTRVSDTRGALTATTAWTPWTEADNGTSGQFLTISNISFSAPKYRVTAKGGGSALRLKRGRTATLRRVAQSSGLTLKASDRLSATVVRASRAICAVTGPRRDRIRALKPGACRVSLVVTSKTGKRSTKRVTITVTR